MGLFNIKCLQCKAIRRVGIVKGITDDKIDWLDNDPNPQKVKIISGRKRFDGNFGWQCICGNDDLWLVSEKRYVEDLIYPKPKEIADILHNLKPEKAKFEMVEV